MSIAQSIGKCLPERHPKPEMLQPRAGFRIGRPEFADARLDDKSVAVGNRTMTVAKQASLLVGLDKIQESTLRSAGPQDLSKCTSV
jgi:hypothetical protein